VSNGSLAALAFEPDPEPLPLPLPLPLFFSFSFLICCALCIICALLDGAFGPMGLEYC
jgi:hypothetical protein